jgi:hypothetical protein
VTAPARSGCFIHGLHLEGARWDTGAGTLAESRHKELYCSMPVVWLRPEQVSMLRPVALSRWTAHSTCHDAPTAAEAHAAAFSVYSFRRSYHLLFVQISRLHAPVRTQS